jgi:hypothetical protein
MTLYEFMEDFDDPELWKDDWQEQMEEAAMKWFEDNKPHQELKVEKRNLRAAVRNYKSWKRDKQRLEE